MMRPRPPRAAMLALLLAGIFCAGGPAAAQDGESSVADRAGRAATRPLRDLNILSATVPEKLDAVARAPYATEGLETCAAIAGEVAALNAILPVDVELTTDADDTTGAAETLVDLGGDVIAGLIPFRRLVRRVSGASAAEARRLRAIDAGRVRRGFLKGLGLSRGCAPPAVPGVPWIRYEPGL